LQIITTVRRKMGDAAARPVEVRSERLRLLEARIRQSRADQLPAAAADGFDSPSPLVAARSRPTDSRSSVGSAVSRSVQGIDRILAPSPSMDQNEDLDSDLNRENDGPRRSRKRKLDDSDPKPAVGPSALSTDFTERFKEMHDANKDEEENSKRKNVSFSDKEDILIKERILILGETAGLNELSSTLGKPAQEIRERYRELINDAGRVNSVDRQQFFIQETSANKTNGSKSHDNTNSRGENSQSKGGTSKKVYSPGIGSNASLKNALKNQPQIRQFFIKKAGDSSDVEKSELMLAEQLHKKGNSTHSKSPPPNPKSSSSSSSSYSSSSKVRVNNSALESGRDLSKQQLRVEIERIRVLLTEKDDQLLRKKNDLAVKDEMIKELGKELQSYDDRFEAHCQKVGHTLEDLLRKTDLGRIKLKRKRIIEDGFRMGRIVVTRHGIGPRGTSMQNWEEGEAFRNLRERQMEVLKRKEEVEKLKRAAQKERRAKKDGDAEAFLVAFQQEEAYTVELQNLKIAEDQLAEERTRLDMEKLRHMRDVYRLRDEDSSRFNQQPTLNDRYLFRELLGKGGFSEVWKGYDLWELRDVAIKVHEMNMNWSEEKKTNYLKHATRENRIHLCLGHPRIVKLYEVLEVDRNSFATVMEYCEGPDLEFYLKSRKRLPEKEARSIVLQILSGLEYLSSGGQFPEDSEFTFHEAGFVKPKQRPSIIHYDLKPGNILFDGKGGVKITDFGLSKIMEASDAESTGIELTSQGAGTYWYLPPECFRIGSVPPKISSKVDVWSTGVIFFQMLYGARPFGEGLTQDRILQNRTMLNANQVRFPAQPENISQEAKDFIRRCLAYNQEDRPDVKTICKDPYLLKPIQYTKPRPISKGTPNSKAKSKAKA